MLHGTQAGGCKAGCFGKPALCMDPHLGAGILTSSSSLGPMDAGVVCGLETPSAGSASCVLNKVVAAAA